MSTGLIHPTFYSDLDFILKNQSAIQNLPHLDPTGNLLPSALNTLSNNNGTTSSSNNSSSALNALSMAAASPTQNAVALVIQQQLNAVVAVQQAQVNQQHQNQHSFLIHNALRLQSTVSQPNAAATAALMMNSLIEKFGHRKLERTRSEPIPHANTSRYKTELCRPFEESGECKYADKCQFAHGMHELRNLNRHPKYKTELCRTFHSVGFCPYGPRCHFVHNAEEAQLYNRAISAEYARKAANAAQRNNAHLPLTPPMSMSTGSDRASPTYLTPTKLISYGLSPVSTPPPTSSLSSPLDDARLPVFNQISSTNDGFSNTAI